MENLTRQEADRLKKKFKDFVPFESAHVERKKRMNLWQQNTICIAMGVCDEVINADPINISEHDVLLPYYWQKAMRDSYTYWQSVKSLLKDDLDILLEEYNK